MKLLSLILLLISSASYAEQWDANDPRLKTDPLTTDAYGDANAYIMHAGLDRLTYELEYDRTGKGIAYKVDQVVNNIVVTGVNQLYAQGFNKEADRLLHEYNQIVTGKIVDSYDLGDHEPWSQWLVKFYNELESLLGHQVMVMLHLDDIWEINYAVPVVFHPKDPRWDIVEYQKHFVPLSGAITYWTTFIACSVITYGSGAIAFVCSPIGSVCEKVMVTCIAPGLSDRIYKRANGL